MTDPRHGDSRALRRALGAFATGVTVVTSRDADGAPVGLTANSFTSVSLEPPLVLVCIGEAAASFGVFRETDRFAVNVLRADQIEIARVFAAKGADRFAAVTWREVVTGAPVLDEAAAWFDCRTHGVTPAGDHVILIGEVVAFGESDAEPLGYHRGGFVAIGAGAKVRLSALVTRGETALVREGSPPRPPSAARFGPDTARDSLLGQIAAAGAAGAFPSPIDAFDVGDTHHVVYHALAPAAARAAPGWRFAPLAEAAQGLPGGESAMRRLRATQSV